MTENMPVTLMDLLSPLRSVEMKLFGDTVFFHECTCYVHNAAVRAEIRIAKWNGMEDVEIAKKWGNFIEDQAPIMRLVTVVVDSVEKPEAGTKMADVDAHFLSLDENEDK